MSEGDSWPPRCETRWRGRVVFDPEGRIVLTVTMATWRTFDARELLIREPWPLDLLRLEAMWTLPATER